jgi:hypothetical protein
MNPKSLRALLSGSLIAAGAGWLPAEEAGGPAPSPVPIVTESQPAKASPPQARKKKRKRKKKKGDAPSPPPGAAGPAGDAAPPAK